MSHKIAIYTCIYICVCLVRVHIYIYIYLYVYVICMHRYTETYLVTTYDMIVQYTHYIYMYILLCHISNVNHKLICININHVFQSYIKCKS